MVESSKLALNSTNRFAHLLGESSERSFAMTRYRSELVALVACLTLALNVNAQATPAEVVKKQKSVAEDQIRTAKLGKMATIETDSLLVYSTLAEDKLKPMAEFAEKVFGTTLAALKHDDRKKPWPGKLTVYVLPERTKEYIPFVKLVEQRSGKIDAEESFSMRLRGDEPSVTVGLASSMKYTDAAMREETGKSIAVAMLDQKAGAPAVPFSLPTWLQDGFSKAMVNKTEPNGKAAQAHRAKVAALSTKSKVSTFSVSDSWGDTKNLNTPTLQTSLVEFMVFGPESAKFEKLLNGFKPSDENREPNSVSALTGAEWKPEDLDVAWKKWLMKK
jgi:hypothetical protein